MIRAFAFVIALCLCGCGTVATIASAPILVAESIKETSDRKQTEKEEGHPYGMVAKKSATTNRVGELNQHCADTWCEGDFKYDFRSAIDNGDTVEVRFTMSNPSYRKSLMIQWSGDASQNSWDCFLTGKNGVYHLVAHVRHEALYGGMNGAINWAESQIKGQRWNRN